MNWKLCLLLNVLALGLSALELGLRMRREGAQTNLLFVLLLVHGPQEATQLGERVAKVVSPKVHPTEVYRLLHSMERRGSVRREERRDDPARLQARGGRPVVIWSAVPYLERLKNGARA